MENRKMKQVEIAKQKINIKQQQQQHWSRNKRKETV